MTLANLLKKCIILLLLLSAVSVLAIMPSSATLPPSSGQQLWFKFDEGIGFVAVDSSGNGHTGTVGSAVSWVTGKVNDAVQFDASANSYVDAGVLSTGISDWSVALWLNSSNIGGDWHDVYAQSTWGQPGHWEIAIDVTSVHCGLAGALALIASNLSPSTICSTFAVNDGAWHHVVVSYNHTYVDFYEDKVLKDQIPVTGDIGVATLHACVGDRDTGSGSCVGGGYPWNGMVDELMVYGRALIQADVDSIYDYSAPVSTATVTTTVPTTTTATVTSTTASTTTSPTTVTHTSTSTVTSPVTSTSTRTTTLTSTVTTTRPTTVTSSYTTTVTPTTTVTSTKNTTRTFSAFNTTRTYNVTQTLTSTSTTTTTTITSDNTSMTYLMTLIGIGAVVGVGGGAVIAAALRKPPTPMPPYIPAGFIQPSPPPAQPFPTRGSYETPAERFRRERGY